MRWIPVGAHWKAARSTRAAGLALVATGLLIGVPGRLGPANADRTQVSLVDCDIQTGPCVKTVEGVEVRLDITPRPVEAMKDLTFRVGLKNGLLESDPYIDLGMPAMEMGPNRVSLKPVDPATYEGKGVIVRCKSGKRTWRATVTLPGLGRAEYIFDVVY